MGGRVSAKKADYHRIKTAKEMYQEEQVKHAVKMFGRLPDSAEIMGPVEWMEQNRYMPAEITEHYGQFDRQTVPHLIEPLSRIHPDDPTTHIALMKSVQSAATTTLVEGAMAYFTYYKLGSCLYLTSTKSMGRVRSSSALDVLIDNAGLAELLKPISGRMKRKTADTTYYKEFSGGVKWLITSYGSIGDLKSNQFHLICPDEWDEAGVEIADQGDIAGIIEGRTMAARQYKILYVSTPSRMETSRIYRSFIEGDQRAFWVPCPLCGKFQKLILRGQGAKHGLTFNQIKDKKTGAKLLDPASVRYICEHCKGEFTEAHKQEMLEAGEWAPGWEETEHAPKSPNHKSYHVQGLISPFLSWTRICQQFINTRFGQDLMLFKDFTINYMGNPWANQVKRATWQELYDRRDKYQAGTIPEGVLQLTAGCDVQLDRVEVLVVGWGKGAESWIIEKRVFFGDTSRLDSAVWAELSYWALSVEYVIYGKKWGVSVFGIDQGFNPSERRAPGRDKDYGAKPHLVQEFVSMNPLFFAVRGVSGAAEIVKQSRLQGSPLNVRYDIAVDTIKELIFSSLEKTGGPGAIHFPDFEQENFRQFCSEAFAETAPGKMGWKKTYQRNEVLDCYVYAYAMAWAYNLIQRTDQMWDVQRQDMIDA